VEHHVAHGLDAAGHHDVVLARADLHGGLDDGLQARAAPPVELHAGHRDRQPCVQGDDAPDRRCLHARIAVPEDDVLDVAGSDTGALE
jgi:hypothetical protein